MYLKTKKKLVCFSKRSRILCLRKIRYFRCSQMHLRSWRREKSARGNRESGAGQGEQKSEWHICSKPAPRCKGRTASRWRACNPPNPHPPPQTPQTVCRGAVYPSRRKKTGTVRRKPAIPPTRRPPSRQAPPQTGACETNNCAKTGKCNKKGEFCRKVALCVRRGS